ncbi:hypothetical protein UlMin_006170 [Ulmus minor]
MDWVTLLGLKQIYISTETPKPKIQRVPDFLRGQKRLEKYYEPRWISIGPIHHCKASKLIQLAEDQYKLDLVANFISNSGQETQVVFSKIMENINEIKNCFQEDLIEGYADETLSWMLFLDGCSILEFIYSFVFDKLKNFKIKKEQVIFALQDLFLLENQIPFRVLKLLMDSSKEKEALKSSIKEFIRANVMAPYKLKRNVEIKMEPEPTHLLDLLRSALLQQSPIDQEDPKADGRANSKQSRQQPIEKKNRYDRQSFRNVQDLRAAGIKLKPSKSCSLRDITFTSHLTACLKLPPLVVDDSMAPKLLNLVAFEMCPDNFSVELKSEDHGVTSYVTFLDSLIDNEEDVKRLRASHVLWNCLSSDAEVARLFNEIGSCLASMPAYPDIVTKIQKHYERKYVKWLAQISHDHFKDPWTILALVGALLALALTGIGTWFTVYPIPGPCDNFCMRKS